MKLIIELPNNLLEEGQIDSLAFLSGTMKQLVAQEVKRQLVDEYMRRSTSFTSLGITKADLKKAVLEKMAEEAVRTKEL